VRYWMCSEVKIGKNRGSETREQRKWVNRVSELENGGKWSIGRLFLLVSLFSLLFTSLDLGLVQMASARAFTTSGSQSSGGGVS
jgi:hypothetical protein